ncbi:MAG: hypothetical protein IJK74_07625 [Bacteroidales bacterium]|nr:hypothetical protein [Bacteroidales bacterium]
MATKIKRSLFIGLGGTGMNSILHTKKMFIESYGEVPPMIGFLGIDTDGGAYKKSLTTQDGKEVVLDPNEQMPIQVTNPEDIYKVNKEDFTWLPEKNLYALQSMHLGAGQVRSNGRFAFTVNYEQVSRRLETILAEIAGAHISADSRWELMSNSTEIHMVFSVCGGTGCGTFINMAYLLREKAPNCKLIGYAVLPDVFKLMSKSGMAKVAPNAFGAIKDLDYLMHLDMGKKPVKLDYIKNSIEATGRPFNSVIFIDNKNNNLDTYTDINELAEMISLALVTSAGELSAASASVGDNLEKNIREGNMDIENKKAWAAGMGVCEIIYRGDDLGKIYSLKGAINLLERFFNSCHDANLLANNWIDSSEVNIRENNGNDHVIDFICKKEPKYELNINDNSNPKPEADQTVQMNLIKDEVINAKVKELTGRVNSELGKLIVGFVNHECGVSTALNVLDSIEEQINIFLGEMTQEKEDLLEMQPRIESELQTSCIDLSEYDKKFLKNSKRLAEYSDDVQAATRKLSINKIEIQRRTAAITVFNNILGKINTERTNVKLISDTFKAIIKKFYSDLAKIQNNVGRTTAVFQLDLAKSSVNTVAVDASEISIPDFVRGLVQADKVYSFKDLSTDQVEQLVLKYSDRLHTARKWRDTSIDEILNKMPEEEFTHLLRQAISKSLPLFRYDYRGHRPKENPQDSFFIGVPDKMNSRLYKNDVFKSMLTGSPDVDFSNIANKDKVIIYRQVGVVPAYAIASIAEYYKEYIDCNANCHFDANLLTRMDREEFSLMPKKTTDEDLLDLWVKGLIFGLIKNEDGMYKVKILEKGDAFDDFWVNLSEFRDEAFDEFRKNKTSIRKEFYEFLGKLEEDKGKEAIKQIIDDVKANYLEKYSQINMPKDKLRQRGFEKIKDLLSSELLLVQKY